MKSAHARPCKSRIWSAVSWGSVEFPLAAAELAAAATATVVFSVDDSALIIMSRNSPAELVRRSSNDVLCLLC